MYGKKQAGFCRQGLKQVKAGWEKFVASAKSMLSLYP
jgi:hypothetical protein